MKTDDELLFLLDPRPFDDTTIYPMSCDVAFEFERESDDGYGVPWLAYEPERETPPCVVVFATDQYGAQAEIGFTLSFLVSDYLKVRQDKSVDTLDARSGELRCFIEEWRKQLTIMEDALAVMA